MLSLLIEKSFDASVVDLPAPIPNDDEVLVKLRLVGFCGSDLNSYRGNNQLASYPLTPGHEVAGEIISLGESVPAHIALGSRVTVNPYLNCGKCASCKRYRPNACQFNKTLGVQRNGAMSEYMVIHWKKLIFSEGLSFEELVLVEPLTVGFHAIERARVIDSDRVAIFGCGVIGLGAVLAAVEKKAEVVVIDFDEDKLSLAQELGATHIINASTTDVEAYLQENFNEKIDVVVEASGNALASALKAVAFSGRLICIGYPKEPTIVDSKLIIQKEIDLLGSRNALPIDFDRVVKFLSAKELPLNKIINKKISIHDAPMALNSWHKNPNTIVKMVLAF